MKIEPITLEGDVARLEFLSFAKHFDGLCRVGLDADLWRWTISRVTTPDEMRNYLNTALAEFDNGVSLPFATIEKRTGEIIGTTRFGAISAENKRIEIGWTFVGKNWQRTAINTEAKFLMLRHAFETWQCSRVELKTDLLNSRSRAAIARLGAVEEGVLRKHVITHDGRVRDTVYFSILDDEWQNVKNNLQNKLKRNNS